MERGETKKEVANDGSKALGCMDCPKMFETAEDLDLHEKKNAHGDHAKLVICPHCGNKEQDSFKESTKRELVCLACEKVLYRKLEVGVDDEEIVRCTGQNAEDETKGDIFYVSHDGYWVIWKVADRQFWTMAGNEDELFEDVFVAFAWVKERME